MKNDVIIKKLITRICEKDLKAQEEFFELLYKKLYQIAVSVLHNKLLAEDAVAELFINITKICSKCCKKKDPLNYILKSQKNISIDILRKEKHITLIPIEYVEATLFYQETRYEDSLFMFFLDKKLNELEKSIVIYKIYDCYSFREIASMLKLSLGKVQRIYKAALKKLEKFYEKPIQKDF